MKATQFVISDVIAKSPSSISINQEIRSIINDPELWAEMEPFLVDPGVTGRKQFDQMQAVNVLLKYDSEAPNTGIIGDAMGAVASLNEGSLWARLQSVLRQVGFEMKSGRIVGLYIADKSGTVDRTDIVPEHTTETLAA